MSKGIVTNVVASVIGALASLLVERLWRRHKERKAKQQAEPQ
jgi:hypothetical protein